MFGFCLKKNFFFFKKKELREKENPYCILLVGNKSDTVANLGEATAAGRALAEQTKLSYFVASAKTGDGVNEVTKKKQDFDLCLYSYSCYFCFKDFLSFGEQATS